MSDLLFRMNDSIDKAYQAANVSYDVLTGDLDVPVTVNGVDIPTLSTRVRDYIDGLGGSLDGKDGLGLEYMVIRDKHLFVKIQDTPEADLGQIVPDECIGLDTVVYDETTGELVINTTDGTAHGPFDVRGEDAVEAVEAYIEDSNLKIRLSDNTVLDGGDISRFGGLSAANADISVDGDLILIYTDGSTQNLGRVRGEKGEDGISLVSGGIDQFGILRLLRSDGKQMTAGLVNATILDNAGNTVLDAEIRSGELVLTLDSGELNLGRIVGTDGTDGTDGDDGVRIAGYRQDGDDVILELSDGSDFNFGPISVTRIYNQAEEAFIAGAEIDTNGHLLIDVTVDGTTTSKDVGKVTGVAGTVLDTATVDATTSELVFTGTEGETFNAGVVEQVTITGMSIDDTTGILTVTLSNNTTFSSTDSVKGTDGADAFGISNLYLDNGNLWVSYEDPALPDGDLGSVQAPVETAVDLTNGELTITLSDGQTFGPFTVKGQDGVYIVSAEVNQGELWVALSDDPASAFSVGMVEQNPASATINADETLTINFDDGSSITTTERVGAYDGDTIESLSIDSTTGDLSIEVSTNNRTNTTNHTVPVVVGRGMTDISLDATTRTLYIDTNMDDGAGGYRSYAIGIPQGLDGDGISGISREGNDLVIEYTKNKGADTATFRAADVYAEGTVTNAYLDSNDDVVIEVDTLPSPVVLETIRGTDGNTIESIGFDGTDLVIVTRDEGETRVPAIRGNDGRGIDSVTLGGVDNTSLVVELTDNTTTEFPQHKGLDASETISNISLGGTDNRDLIIERPSGDLTVSLLRGEDGVTINRAEIIGTQLEIDVSDQASTLTYDFETLRGVDGNSVTDVYFSGRDLIIETNVTGKESIVLEDTKGTDGSNIASIDPVAGTNDFEIVMDDDSTAPTKYTLGDLGRYITDVQVVNNKLEVTFNDTTTLTTTDDVVGRDGNGTGIDSITFTNGQLDVVLSDAAGNTTPVNAGSVEMVSVTNARIDVNTTTGEGILVLEQDNGDEITVGNVYGETGRSVSGVAPITVGDERHLEVRFSNGDVIDAGSIQGVDGRSIVDASVGFGGDLTVEYDNGTFDLIGNIGTGAGLTIWDIDKTPYVKDQVVIYDGALYMSEIDNNNSAPPTDWKPFSLGDQIVEVRKPVALSPVGGATSYTVNPTLDATVYAPIVSVDGRDYREFQVDVLAGDFSAPVYTVQVDSDSHTVVDDLSVSTDYKWRCRDVSSRGYTSDWSDEVNFTVPAGVIDTPTINIHPDEDANNAFIAPEFQSSAYSNTFDSEPHVETDWQVRRASDQIVVWESLNDATNLESVIVPNDVLGKGESYEVHVKHRSTNVESAWSSWLTFTVSTMDYAETPSVTGDSENFVASPFDKTVEFEAYPSVGLDLNRAIWTVVKVSDGSIYAQDVKTSDFSNYDLDISTIESNADYQITVEYVSDRFGSIVSDPFMFQFVIEVSSPTVSTLEDINSFPSGGVFTSSAFNGTNETHVSSDWEVRDLNSDELLWSSIGDTENLESIVFDIGGDTSLRDLTIRVRHNGEFISSGWSNELSFFTEEFMTGPGPRTLLAGDMTDGFFGEVPVTELFSGDELASLIGLTEGTSQHSNEPWLKFVIDEKIVFIAKKPYRHTVSWNHINAVNAVYDDTNAPVVSAGGLQFRVTLMTGSDTDPESGAGGEWNRLMYRVHQDDPTNTNWASYTDADIVVGSGDGRSTWTHEKSRYDARERVTRGGNTSLVNFNTNTSDNSNSNNGWRPALRLIV